MKILKKLLPLTFVAIASTAEADFLEAIQMSSKARSQIEFIDTESAQGRALVATYNLTSPLSMPNSVPFRTSPL